MTGSQTIELELQIGALGLTGFPTFDAERFGAALSDELTRLFAAGGVPASLNESWGADAMQLAPLELPRHVAPEWLGARVAQELYAGLQRR